VRFFLGTQKSFYDEPATISFPLTRNPEVTASIQHNYCPPIYL